jgi:outer membrane lipoprotein carrier protein
MRRHRSLMPAALVRGRFLCRFLLVVCLVVGAGVPVRAFGGVTGAEVIQRAQARLSRCRTLTASFEKRFYWAALDRTTTHHGRLYLRRPDRFRVEVDDGNLVIADGQAIWVYSRRNAQVVVNPYEGEVKSPWEVLLEYQDSHVPGEVEETRLGNRPCYLLTLLPRDADAGVVQTRVWVGQRDSLLLQVEQRDVSDDVTTYVLNDQRANASLDDRVFRFVPPDGTEVIDRRGPAGGSE